MRKFKDRAIVVEKIFTEHDWACFHDAILNATDIGYTQKKLEFLFKQLPDNIKYTAFQWGMSDTVFGDEVYRHFIEKSKPKEAPIKSGWERESSLILCVGKKGIGTSRIEDMPNLIRLHKKIQ